MRFACLGDGPAGLYFAISMKLRGQSHSAAYVIGQLQLAQNLNTNVESYA